MSPSILPDPVRPILRRFLDSEAAGGLVLMLTAALALVVANSPLGHAYFHILHVEIGPLSLQHWINDALMALFFLLVGLEIKREMLEGQLSSASQRILPGAAAAGGMLAPALIYVLFNLGNGAALRGWAIPAATDIAFALGVLSLFGTRVPASLKIFLAALAIIDDLGAVVVIALFYTSDLNLPALAGAAVVMAALVVLNRRRVQAAAPYAALGLLLWLLVFASGIHATLAGVMLALTIPLRAGPGAAADGPPASLLHRAEHGLHKPVAFVIVPLFGFANAGVSFAGISSSAFTDPVMLGVAGGLFLGKICGVLGTVALLVRLRFARLPVGAGWGQVTGVALLCGIGFTMSLFIGMLAFDDPALQDHVKIGILLGSLLSGLAGSIVLAVARRPLAPAAAS